MFIRRTVIHGASKRILRFLQGQGGAVTIEWVVLTSAVIVLAAGVGGFLSGEGDNSVHDTLRDMLSRALERAAISDTN